MCDIKDKLKDLPKAIHYESEIDFLYGSNGEIQVLKTYRQDVEAVKWLNNHLEKYYDKSIAMPIAQHEAAAIRFLEKYGFVPLLIDQGFDWIKINFAGYPIDNSPPIGFFNYIKQAFCILRIFKRVNFKHNDLLSRNVLVFEKKIKIIDFTMSEFNDVEIMKFLPNKNWARPNRDFKIFTYVPIMQNFNKWRSKNV